MASLTAVAAPLDAKPKPQSGGRWLSASGTASNQKEKGAAQFPEPPQSWTKPKAEDCQEPTLAAAQAHFPSIRTRRRVFDGCRLWLQVCYPFAFCSTLAGLSPAFLLIVLTLPASTPTMPESLAVICSRRFALPVVGGRLQFGLRWSLAMRWNFSTMVKSWRSMVAMSRARS